MIWQVMLGGREPEPERELFRDYVPTNTAHCFGWDSPAKDCDSWPQLDGI